MEITTILSLVRRYAGVNSTQYPDPDFLQDINMVKDEYWSLKVATKLGKINYDIWTVDNTIANQSEYRLPEITSSTAGTKVVKSVSINYDGDTYDDIGTLIYTPAVEVNPNTLKYDWDYYVENQSKDKPIYYYSDKSIFIAPAFKAGETGANRIKIEGVRKIPDYTLSSTEAEMKLDVDEQRVLMWGCIPLALMSKRTDNGQISKAQADYIRERDTALRVSSDMVEGPSEMKYPGFTETEDIL